MYDEILEKLKNQRGTTSNVSDRSLEDMAKSLEPFITDAEALVKADFTKAIESIDGNLNHYTAEQVKAASKKQLDEIEAKKVADALEKKKLEDGKGADPEKPDIKSIIADALAPLTREISTLKAEKATQSRSDLLQAEIAKTPVIFKDTTTKAFKRMNFETDEEFTEYLTEVKEGAKEAIQIGNESGLRFTTPTNEVHKPDPDDVSPEMEKALTELTTNTEEKKPF